MAIPNEEIGQFKAGESGNPNGRPKGKGITSILRELLEKQTPKTVADSKIVTEFLGKKQVTNGEALVVMLLYKALIKNDMKAITEILDRIDGKPIQQTIVSEAPPKMPIWLPTDPTTDGSEI